MQLIGCVYFVSEDEGGVTGAESEGGEDNGASHKSAVGHILSDLE